MSANLGISQGIQTVGTCLSIASGCPPSFDLAGFESMNYVGTIEVENFNELPATKSIVSWPSVCPGVLNKLPGIKDFGAQSLVITHVSTDPALQLLKGSFADSTFVCVRIIYANGETDYYLGFVTTDTKAIGGDSDHITSQCTITRRTGTLEVPVVLVLTVAGNVEVDNGQLCFRSNSQTVQGETITNHKWTITVADPGEPNDGRVIEVNWPDGGTPTITDSNTVTPITAADITGGDSSWCFTPQDVDMLLSPGVVISTDLEVADSAGNTANTALNPTSPATSITLGVPTASGAEAYDTATQTVTYSSTSTVAGGVMTALVYELVFNYPGDVNDGRTVLVEWDNQADPSPTVTDSRNLLDASQLSGSGAMWSFVANATNDFYVPTGVGSIDTTIIVQSQFIQDEVTL